MVSSHNATLSVWGDETGFRWSTFLDHIHYTGNGCCNAVVHHPCRKAKSNVFMKFNKNKYNIHLMTLYIAIYSILMVQMVIYDWCGQSRVQTKLSRTCSFCWNVFPHCLSRFVSLVYRVVLSSVWLTSWSSRLRSVTGTSKVCPLMASLRRMVSLLLQDGDGPWWLIPRTRPWNGSRTWKAKGYGLVCVRSVCCVCVCVCVY